MKKLLQGLGALALLAWTVAGTAAWLATKGQVHVVVSADDPAAGPDPVALLADDVATLHRDLTGLTETLGANFSILDERVSNAVAASARTEPAADHERELRMRIAELEARLDVLENALRGAAPRPEGALAAGAVGEPAAGAARPKSSAFEAAPETGTPESATPDPAPTASFLAFQLPSQRFELDRRRRWTIQPSLSRVGFDGKSSLHDFTGATSGVEGELVANPARPADAPEGRIVVDATSLDTGLDDRDAAMHEHLSSTEFQTFEFELESFERAGATGDDGVTRGTVRGTMRIHGVSRAFAMPVELSVDESRRLVVEGSAPLSLTDYGVPVPNKLGIVKMEDEVVVWIALRARAGAVVE